MTRQKRIEELLELMKNPDHIRNVGIIAHIDHGKCVAGETRLCFVDGNVYKAEEFFKFVSKECAVVLEAEDRIVYDSRKLNQKLYSLNIEDGAIESHPIKYAWRIKGGPLLRVTLRTGFEVSTTPEHKFLVFDGSNFVYKMAKDITIGEWVVCSRQISQETNIDLKSIFLESIANVDGFYVVMSHQFNKQIKNLLKTNEKKENIQRFSDLSSNSFACGVRKRRYRLADIKRICDHFEIPLNQLYDEIEVISYRSGKKNMRHGKSSFKIRLPKSFDDFYYLAGLLMGDGSYDKFVVEKPELGSRFKRICINLGTTPSDREYEGKCPEINSGGGLTLLKILDSLFDYPLRKKSQNITISKFLFLSPDRYVSSLIRGYFDCVGSVEFSRRAVSISSSSQNMLKNLQLLLLRFGCLSTLQNHKLFISGSSAKHFRDKINFSLVEKKKNLSKLCEPLIGSQTSDLIPISGGQLKNLRSGNPKTRTSNHFYKYEQGIYLPTRATLFNFLNSHEEMNGNIEQMKRLLSPDIAFIQVKKIAEDFADYVYDFTIEPHHNFIAEGIIIHNTTLSDSLLANAGLLNLSLVGDARALDFLEEEQRRGITIKAANISLLHDYQGSRYVVNLVDTPGHVDFSGKVSRALRAIDGAIVVVDAVEGVMAQTESVIRSAIKEQVKPVVFINKIDRLIRELKLSSTQIQERLSRIIQDVNKIIAFASGKSNQDYKIGIETNTVAFGSALHKWAFTVGLMQKANLQFRDIIEIYQKNAIEKLSKLLPIHDPILNMIIDCLPSPRRAQKTRIEYIWKGKINSPAGTALRLCDSDGPFIFSVNKVIADSKHGLIAVGRLFSGTIRKGTQIQIFPSNKLFRTQRVTLFMGSRQVVIPSLTAGNICGIIGSEEVRAGDTITGQQYPQGMVPFEEIEYISEPVVTIAIEPKQTKDLTRLQSILKNLTTSDPNLVFSVNEQTGENLLSGLGLLHLEIAVKDIKDAGVPLYASDPIVLYRETARSKISLDRAHPSPNGKNSLRITIHPQHEKRETTQKGSLWKKDSRGNLLANMTDITIPTPAKKSIIEGFVWAMERGPLCGEQIGLTSVQMKEITLSSDIGERSRVELMSMVREAIFIGLEKAGTTLLEPIYSIEVIVPIEFQKETVRVIMSKRGQIDDIKFEQDWTTILGWLPVGESFDLADTLRSNTSGKAIWQTKFARWQVIPKQRAPSIISDIKKRRGLR